MTGADQPIDPTGAATPTNPEADLVAEVDGRGTVRSTNPAFAAFVASPDGPHEVDGDVVGRSLDDLAVGSSRRTIVRAAADASATGARMGPIDLWLGAGEPPVVGRFWVEATEGGRFRLTGHDLADLDPVARTAALETMLLDRVASGDPAGTVLRGVAQLIEWRLPGARCSIGTMDADGVIRHRAGGSLPAVVVDALDRMAPTAPMAVAARGPEGLRRFDDLSPLPPEARAALGELGVVRCITAPVDDGAGLAGLLAVFLPDRAAVDGALYSLLRHATDIADAALARARGERHLVHAALHDNLTGLPNRRLLVERIGQALARTARSATTVAVLMIDLDDFKLANDSLGHEAGDRVLTEVASMLRAAVPVDEVVGRFGGDEFLVVATVTGPDQAGRRAEALRVALDTAVPVGSVFVRTAASIGVAVAGPDDDAETLLRDADAALHRAKRDGRNQVAVFDQALRDALLARVELETDLRRGLSRREIEVHYQPIVDLETFAVIGAEALVRWSRDGEQLVPPADFVAVAEDAGLIAELGREVIEQALAVAAEIRRLGWTDFVVSVNVSPHQLSPSLVDAVVDALAGAGMPAEALMLEITETALALRGADAIVERLADHGVGIAVDDFGTGYSSLDHLRRFRLADVVKIDASFVADLEGPDVSGQAIVAAALALGHSLGMNVVAEGVETVGQLQLLREMGCERAQGYLMSPAVSAHDLPGALGQVVPGALSG